MSATRCRSRTRLYGLVGDSLKISRVVWRTASSMPLVVAGGDDGDLDAVAAQDLQHELPRAPVGVVGEHDVRALRQHREQGGGDRRHAAREQQPLLGRLERRQLALRDALRRIAVAAVLLALDAALEVVGELGGVGEGVGRGLDDRLGDGVDQLGARLAAVDGAACSARRAGNDRAATSDLQHLDLVGVALDRLGDRAAARPRSRAAGWRTWSGRLRSRPGDRPSSARRT